MKKNLLGMLFILAFTSLAYGATSDDVYLRRDVFDAKMEAAVNQIHGDIRELDAKLTNRLDGIDARMSDLRNGFYLACVILGIVLSLPMFNKLYERKKEYDVEKLVERLVEAKLNAKLQTL